MSLFQLVLKQPYCLVLQTSMKVDEEPAPMEVGSVAGERILAAFSMSRVASLPAAATGSASLQKIRRLLLLAERYVSRVEEAFPTARTILPHAATFLGRPLMIEVVHTSEGKREERFFVQVGSGSNLWIVVE